MKNLYIPLIISAYLFAGSTHAKDPEEIIEVDIVFETGHEKTAKATKSIKDVVKLAKRNNLTIKELKHSTSYNAGGYVIGEDEDLETVEKNYEEAHYAFMLKRIELLDEVLESGIASEHQESIRKQQEEIYKSLYSTVNSGLKIHGIRVKGEVKDINSMQEPGLSFSSKRTEGAIPLSK